MKLLFCPTCNDIRAIHGQPTTCACGKVEARYVDNINVEWNGVGSLLGFANMSFIHAMRQHVGAPRKDRMGHAFEAFFIPNDAPTVRIK